MYRWGLVPALLLAVLFLSPAAFVSDGPGTHGLEVTAQFEGQRLAVVAFSPFCVVVRFGNSDFGITTSYLVRRVQLADSNHFDATPGTSLILNPRGREDVRVPVSFGGAPIRARWVPLAFAEIGAPLDAAGDTG